MTKKVRVENADTSTYKVKVYTEILHEGQWVRLQGSTRRLAYPAALEELYIHSTQRLVVEEYQEETAD